MKKNNSVFIVIIFFISALTLELQLLHTRMFSVIFWHHMTYFIVTMGLLGFAASGTYLAVSKRAKKLDDRPFLILCLAGFSISAFAGMFIISNLKIDSFAIWKDPINLLYLILSYALVMVPYFFSGLAICGVFMRYPGRKGFVYFANLLGSGIGCLLFVLLIKPLGAEVLFFVTLIAAAVPVFFLLKWKSAISKTALALACTVFLVVVSVLYGSSIIKIVPDGNKLYWTWFKNRYVEFSEWNPISLISVVSEKGQQEHVKRILIDGDAQTPMFKTNFNSLRRDRFIESPHRDVAYSLLSGKEIKRALVIGAGGGTDVLSAYKNGAQKIDAVEINPTIVDITKGRYSDFIGNIYRSDRVNLHLEDGRGFVNRSRDLYDVIMIYATDSFAALSSGAYVLAESYLYTVEAISEYWKHLDDYGVLQISRWFYSKIPRETLRVFTTALEGLSLNGVKDPSRHIVVITDNQGVWADVIISKRLIDGQYLSLVIDQCRKSGMVLYYAPSIPDVFMPPESVFTQAASFFGTTAMDIFYEKYPFNIRPVTDDNPFFFQYSKWKNAFRKLPGHTYYDSIRGNWPFFILFSLLIQSCIFVMIFVWLPLAKMKKLEGNMLRHSPILVYFLLLGLGFMFIEIVLTQKFILFLGHPIYSMVVIIPTILISAGIGSLCSSRFKIKPARSILFAVLGICILGVLFAQSDFVFSQFIFLGTPLIRVVMSILCLLPLGFLMGIPFPTAIQRVSDTYPRLIPLAWAINGGFSVIGSILAIIVAMTASFSRVVVFAGAFYIIACLCFLAWDRNNV